MKSKEFFIRRTQIHGKIYRAQIFMQTLNRKYRIRDCNYFDNGKTIEPTDGEFISYVDIKLDKYVIQYLRMKKATV